MFDIYLGFLLCFIPFILCFVFFKIFSSLKFSTALAACFLGLLAVLPVSFLEYLNQGEKFVQALFPLNFQKTITVALLGSFIICGILEEGFKILFVSFIPKKNITFNNFFMASLLAGLCVGCFETLVYFVFEMGKNQVRGGHFLYNIFFMRCLGPDMIHMFCTGLSGIFVWSLYKKQKDVVSLIMSVLIHGLYDFFAIQGQMNHIFRYFAVFAVLFAVIECRIHYVRNKPAEEYKKDPVPAKDNKDKTIESVLKITPEFDSNE